MDEFDFAIRANDGETYSTLSSIFRYMEEDYSVTTFNTRHFWVKSGDLGLARSFKTLEKYLERVNRPCAIGLGNQNSWVKIGNVIFSYNEHGNLCSIRS